VLRLAKAMLLENGSETDQHDSDETTGCATHREHKFKALHSNAVPVQFLYEVPLCWKYSPYHISFGMMTNDSSTAKRMAAAIITTFQTLLMRLCVDAERSLQGDWQVS
jgi:hypothetical protein